MKARVRDEVDLPGGRAFAEQLFRLLKARGPVWVKPRDIHHELVDALGLDHVQQRAGRRTRPNEPKFYTRIHTARKHLVELGLLDGSRRTFWKLTQAGLAADSIDPISVSLEDLLKGSKS
jgi:restriction endonuclease Mrr